MLKRVTKTTAGFLAATMLGNSWAAPKYQWKPVSIVAEKYEKISEKVKPEEKTKYALSAEVAENLLTIHVAEEVYNVQYDVLRVINIERQQQERYKISTIARVTNIAGITIGFGSLTLAQGLTGSLFTFSPELKCGEFPSSYLTDSADYSSWHNYISSPNSASGDDNYDRGAQDWYDCYREYVTKKNIATALLGTGAAIGAIGITVPLASKKAYRPTNEYREVDMPTDLLKEKERGNILNKSSFAVHIPVQVSSKYFTINGKDTAQLYTDSTGTATARLDSDDQNFAFSLSGLADTTIAEQLRAAGYKNSRFLPKLQETALPISYDVTVETNMQDGDTVSITVPVKGFVFKDSALERVIMGL